MHTRQRRFAVVLVLVFSFAQITAAHTLAPAADAGSSFFSSAPRFSLPWVEGTAWRFTGGPHSNTGRGRPWSSIDFAGPLSGVAYRVTAAAGGTVDRPCPNLVVIRHGDGWRTSYYHLKDVRVRDGQRVQRGQVLGLTSTRAGCGGYATGAHVHFTILYRGEPVNIRGMRIGGWVVRESDYQYVGCLVRDDIRRCAPSGRVRNFGI